MMRMQKAPVPQGRLVSSLRVSHGVRWEDRQAKQEGLLWMPVGGWVPSLVPARTHINITA